MSDLTDLDAEKLFNEISQASRTDDSVKLLELMEKQAPDEDEKEEKEQPLEEERTEDEDGKSDDEDVDSKEEEESSQDDDNSASKSDDEDKSKDETDPELAKLREQLDKLNKENHTLRSQAGRVPHVQKRLSEMDKKLEELRKAQSSPSSQNTAQLQAKIDAALAGIKKDDAELADSMAKAILEAVSGITSESATKEIETLSFLREQEAKSYQQEQLDLLLDTYPNAPEVFKSTSWKNWVDGQSNAVKNLANSNTADDVIFAFDKYTKDMIRLHPELAPKDDNKSNPSVDAEAEAKAKKIEEERQRKKNTSADVRSKNAAGKQGMPDDPEALFKKFSEELRKERSGV